MVPELRELVMSRQPVVLKANLASQIVRRIEPVCTEHRGCGERACVFGAWLHQFNQNVLVIEKRDIGGKDKEEDQLRSAHSPSSQS